MNKNPKKKRHLGQVELAHGSISRADAGAGDDLEAGAGGPHHGQEQRSGSGQVHKVCRIARKKKERM